MQVVSVDVGDVERRRQRLRDRRLARAGDAHHRHLEWQLGRAHQSWTVPSRSRL